jgi:16S rRNA (guanine(1405)-N(7))-methyltransferase
MAAQAGQPAVGQIAEQVLGSAKYRGLDRSFVLRLAGEATLRFDDRTQAVKYTKRKLHEAFGAFRVGTPARAIQDCLARLEAGDDQRDSCQVGMRSHASAAERIDWLPEIYAQIEAWCGRPATVADLACGLNPLALPWMALADGASYSCCEVDRGTVAALGRLDQAFGFGVQASVRDLVSDPGPVRAELVLLLKLVTTLEQQRKGAAQRVLAGVQARHVVLSLPRGSLSGRRYSDDGDAIVDRAVAGTGLLVSDSASFGGEAFYHLVPAALDQLGSSSPR